MQPDSLARATDVETSHEAATELVMSGQHESQLQVVLEATRRHPGHTSAELAAVAGLDRYMVARRRPDLEKRGLVSKDASSHCTVTGRRARIWFAKTGAPAQ